MCIMSHQFSGVSNVATEVDVNLKDITALLDNEVEEEENFQVLEFKKTHTNYRVLNLTIVKMEFYL